MDLVYHKTMLRQSSGIARLQNRGVAIAQNNLGYMYYNGLGVPQDYIQAYAWFQLAAEGGLEEATTEHMAVRGKMNSKELEEARKLVKELWD